jgi:hypothetical protein
MGGLPAEVVAAFVERCRAERVAAGLPEHLEDPVVAERIAGLVSSPPRTRRGRGTTSPAPAAHQLDRPATSDAISQQATPSVQRGGGRGAG